MTWWNHSPWVWIVACASFRLVPWCRWEWWEPSCGYCGSDRYCVSVLSALPGRRFNSATTSTRLLMKVRTMILVVLAIVCGGSVAVGVNQIASNGRSLHGDSADVVLVAKNITRGSVLSAEVLT